MGWHSAAASALRRLLSKNGDLVREAVNCNAVFGGIFLRKPYARNAPLTFEDVLSVISHILLMPYDQFYV